VSARGTGVPLRLAGHGISAAGTRRLRTARPLPPTDEVLRRQTSLEAAIKEYPARRAEVPRCRSTSARRAGYSLIAASRLVCLRSTSSVGGRGRAVLSRRVPAALIPWPARRRGTPVPRADT